MSTDVTTIDEVTKATTDRNITLTFDLLREALADPTILDEIPDGVNLVLLLKDDPAFNEINIEIGLKNIRRGQDVYFRYLRERPSSVESEDSSDRPAE